MNTEGKEKIPESIPLKGVIWSIGPAAGTGA